MPEEWIAPLKWADGFYKNCLLLCNDMAASIAQKTLTSNLEPVLGPEGSWAHSEFLWRYIFGHDGRIRFIFLLAKPAENLLRAHSSGFKAVCQELEIDPVFPLVIVAGVLDPRDARRFRGSDLWIKRKWLFNTVLLEVPQNVHLANPEDYQFDELITVQSEPDTDPQFCERAVIEVNTFVDELLAMAADEEAHGPA
jgi:hypothetical protein